MDHDDDFAAFADDAWASLVRSAVFLGCSLHEAEDLAQVTLTRCYTAWPRVVAADDRRAYVYRMLVNGLRDSRRRRWWGEHAVERLPERATADHSDAVATTDAVHRALDHLTKQHRDVVVLRYFAGLTEQETARALDTPAGTVKSRLSRALHRLASDDHLRDLRPEGTSS